jgi:hypothetical protein
MQLPIETSYIVTHTHDNILFLRVVTTLYHSRLWRIIEIMDGLSTVQNVHFACLVKLTVLFLPCDPFDVQLICNSEALKDMAGLCLCVSSP